MSVPPPQSNLPQAVPADSTAGKDLIEEEALDWLMRIESAPEDNALRDALAAWRREAVRHEKAYARVERVWRLAAALPREPATSIRRPRPRRRVVFSAAAAALAATVLIFLAPVISLHLSAGHLTGVGEVRKIDLPDGSTVALDAETALAIDYTAERRGLRLLAGRAFFEVTQDTQRPFVVATEDLEVTVTGTSFAVAIAESGESVAVGSGSVRAQAGGDKGGTAGAEYDMRSGDRLMVRANDRRVSRSRVKPADVAAWREGLLVADSMALSEVVEQLGRYHRGVIWLRDPALSAGEVTGVFNLADPTSALRAAAATQGGRVVAVTPYILLVEASD